MSSYGLSADLTVTRTTIAIRSPAASMTIRADGSSGSEADIGC